MIAFIILDVVIFLIFVWAVSVFFMGIMILRKQAKKVKSANKHKNKGVKK